jgi:hypothetical protein
VPASLTIAIALLCAIMIGIVACSSPSQSQEVSFPTADGGTVVADLYAASDAVVLGSDIVPLSVDAMAAIEYEGSTAGRLGRRRA